MKNSKVLNGLMLAALVGVLIVGGAWSYGGQQGKKGAALKGKCGQMQGLNLSESQQEQMKTIHLNFLQEITPLKNDLEIKKAQLKAASVGSDVDQKSAFKLMDEIGDLKTEIAKKRFVKKQKVRALLTDDQKILFDAHSRKGQMFGTHNMEKKKGRYGTKRNCGER